MSDDMPLQDAERWASAPPATIDRQIIAQLTAFMRTAGLSQQRLGLLIEQEQPFVSRLLRGQRQLTLAQAEMLDEHPAAAGDVSYRALVQRREEGSAEQRARRRYRGNKLFLAGSMSAPTTTYEDARAGALDLANALEEYCGFDVYYAGREISSPREFDAADLGYRLNFEQLKQSDQFVLLWEGMPKEPRKAVSSIWVEAGMALAQGIPSTYFVPDLDSLPYILQQAVSHRRETAPKITIRRVASAREAVDLVKRSKIGLFP